MNQRCQATTRVALAMAAVFAVSTPSFAQVKVIISGGFAPAYREVLPEFERATGITVATGSGASQGNAADTIGAQLRRGVPADVVIMSREGLSELIKGGKILAGTDIDLAETPLGIAVRAGSPRPDIRTVDAFTQTLLLANSVASASTTGIYLATELFPRLGIVNKITLKITNRGAESAALVASGDAKVAVQPVSELLQAPGVDFVGPIPAAVQHVMVFAAAVTASSKEPEASKRLLAYLSSESARAAIKKSGMEPSRRR